MRMRLNNFIVALILLFFISPIATIPDNHALVETASAATTNESYQQPVTDYDKIQKANAEADAKSRRTTKAALLLGVGIAIFGLYKGYRGDIVVFANLTDVIPMLAAVAIPVILLILCNFLELPSSISGKVSLLTFFVLFALVIKATRAYNYSFLGSALAIFTKVFISALYVAVVAFILFYGVSSRKKYESQARYAARARRETGAAVVGVSGIFAFLAVVGLRTTEIVSISDYLSGRYEGESVEDVAEESESISE